MSWQKKNDPQHKELLDLRTGMHIIPLHEPDSGAEHKLQIETVHDSCPLCGHVKPKTNLGEIDAKKLITDEIAALNLSHNNQRAYARKHSVPVRGR